METEMKIKHLQMLIEDYQLKVKDFNHWKDHYLVLQSQFNAKQEVCIQHRIPTYYIPHLQYGSEEFKEFIRIEVAKKLATELVKHIQILSGRNNTNGEDCYEIGCRLTIIP